MPTDTLEAEVEAATAAARDDDDLALLEVAEPPATETFELTERPLPEAVELARDLGAREVYLFTSRTGDGDLGRAGVAFFHRGHVHAAYRESTAWNAQLPVPTGEADAGSEATDGDDPEGASADAGAGAGSEASDPDAERKEELAAELLGEYGEYVEEGDEYRLRNRLEYLPVSRLLEMREEARERARIDPEEEDRLARIVFRDGRFNRRYDARDTAMLLDALDLDYDEREVRVEQIHETAMSLLTMDQ